MSIERDTDDGWFQTVDGGEWFVARNPWGGPDEPYILARMNDHDDWSTVLGRFRTFDEAMTWARDFGSVKPDNTSA